jgi:hypothetical protein
LSFAAFRLWVKNAAKESADRDHAQRRETGGQGGVAQRRQSIDTYTLGGFAQAMDRLAECPGKRRQGCV